MGRKWSMRGDNRGVSLIAVIVIVMVVGIIGAAVTQSTITNVKMKEVERAGKANFYSAEGVVDELAAGINIKAAIAMQKAYTTILSDYRSVMTEGSSIQKKFTETYMGCLREEFAAADNTPSALSQSGAVYYEVGAYNADKIKDECIKTAEYKTCWQDPTDAKYHIDYAKGIFTLKNICVRYQDGAYETIVHTDIVLHTPALNFKGSNMIKGFMRYGLVADGEINATVPQNVMVESNVYGGDGINCGGSCKAVFSGNTIVTRQKITVSSGAEMTMGSATSRIWAENVETVGTYGSTEPSPAKITLEGAAYIADDLSLNASNSQVKLKGSYYGYNFRENYAATTSDAENRKAAFSSAILINGRNCKLDLTETGYLLLSGRTFLSQSTSDVNDVLLGESLSVRSNQMAYYVPEMFLDTANNCFIDNDDTRFSTYIGVPNVSSYLDNPPVVKYQSAEGETAYYLNFKNGKLANDFFVKFAAARSDVISRYANMYAPDDAIVIGSGLYCTMKGDILVRAGEGDPLTVKRGVQIAGDWDNRSSLYWSYANEIAKKYKSLQISLEENEEIEDTDIRFYVETGDDRKVDADKTSDKLVAERLLRIDELTAFSSQSLVDEEGNSLFDGDRVVVVTTEENYNIPTEYTGGVIIAKNNVSLAHSFNGLIMAGGNIELVGNVTVTSDEMLVSDLFSKNWGNFAEYFNGYNTFSESVIGQVEIEKYLSYDNWTKTKELNE